MTNVLGGGGGENGFRHLLAHLGPAIEGWVKDMKDHAFEFSEENIQKLDNSVHKMLESTDVKEVEHQRDKALIDLINRKKDLGALK